MNTNDLFDIAIGMGLNKPFMGVNKILYCDEELQDYPEFNPTIGDLILWLMERGNLDLYDKIEVSFFKEHDDYTGFGSQSEKTLKENLLNIALETIRAEKENE